MPNYLKMPKKSQVLALLELGWSYRRIEAETGVRRETVSGYDAGPPGKCGQNVPRLRSLATRRMPSMLRSVDRFKCGQNVRRLGVKPGQNVPRLRRRAGGSPPRSIGRPSPRNSTPV